MNHQPFEDWLLNYTSISPEQRRDLDLHVRTCAYCAALIKTDRVLRTLKMASPANGFVTRFQVRLATQKVAGRRRRILGSILFTVTGLILIAAITSPYLVTFFAAPATWIAILVEWGLFLVTTMQAAAQAGVVILDVLQGILPPFAWMVMLSTIAGVSLLWSVSIWRFVRVPQGV